MGHVDEFTSSPTPEHPIVGLDHAHAVRVSLKLGVHLRCRELVRNPNCGGTKDTLLDTYKTPPSAIGL